MLALLVWLVLLVAAAKTHSVKQVLVAGTKQTKQANKADRLTRQAGRQGGQGCLICIWPACCVLCPLLTPLFFFKSMFHKLICVEQSTFLRCLCNCRILYITGPTFFDAFECFHRNKKGLDSKMIRQGKKMFQCFVQFNIVLLKM
jgi:hypothetical protein